MQSSNPYQHPRTFFGKKLIVLTVAGHDQRWVSSDLLRLVDEHSDVVRVGTKVAELGQRRSRDRAETCRCGAGAGRRATAADGGRGRWGRSGCSGETLAVVRVDLCARRAGD